MNERARRSSGGGCGKALLACGVLILLFALAAVALVAFNWNRVTGAIGTAKAALQQVVDLRTELQERYPSARIVVKQQFGSDQRSLGLELVDPQFLEEGADGEAAAREIAVFALQRWPDPESLDAVVVQFTRTGSGAVPTTSRVAYDFPVSELRGGGGG